MTDKLFFLESSKNAGGSINSLSDNVAFLHDKFDIAVAYYRKNKYTDYFDNSVKTFHIKSAAYSGKSLRRKALSLNKMINAGSALGRGIDKFLFKNESRAIEAAIKATAPQKIIANISPVIDRPIYYTGYRFIQHFRSVSGINSKSAQEYKHLTDSKIIKCIYNSRYTKKIWEDNLGELAPSEVIYNPFKKNKKNATSDDAFKIGMVSRFEKRKNHIKLVEAFEALTSENKKAQLFLYGEGEEKENISNYIKNKNLSNVYLMGLEYDKDKMYGQLDAVVLPSYDEPLGRVLIEAMSYGLPVIGSNAGGITEIVEDGYNGFLVKPADHLNIAEAIEKLFDAATYKKMQHGANQIFDERFNEDVVMPQLLNAYTKTENLK